MPKQTGKVIDFEEVRARTRGNDLNVPPRGDAEPVGAVPQRWRILEGMTANAPSAIEPLNMPSALPNFRTVADMWSAGAGNIAQRSRNATNSERNSWASFLRTLAANEKLTDAQRDAALDVWQRALETEPNVMYPTVRTDPEAGTLYFSWNPRPLSFEIEIEADGRLEWHFADYDTGSVDGSSDPQAELEPIARTLLRLFRRADEVGRASARG